LNNKPIGFSKPDRFNNKEVGFNNCLSIAVGVWGLSRNDFLDLTPFEFQQAHKAWLEVQTLQYRAQWEQTRWLAAVVVQPHAKRRLRPADLIRFNWE
jgi:hypothetical protein